MPSPHAAPPRDHAQQLLHHEPALEVIPQDPTQSARWHQHDYPGPFAQWNHHPEYEVHLITASTGRFIVGDYVGGFEPGNLVLVGPHLPHHWVSDLAPGDVVRGRDVVLQFLGTWVRELQRVLPEVHAIDDLLRRATTGLEFSGEAAVRGAAHLQRIGATSGLARAQAILGLLDELAQATEVRALASFAMTDPARFAAHPTTDLHRTDAMSRAITYIFENLTGNVSLTHAATLAHMSPSAFSKYFQRASGQTFSSLVRKLRLAHACRLLAASPLPVSDIAVRVGYSNLSNFNRQFRAEHGVTPREYRTRSQQP